MQGFPILKVAPRAAKDALLLLASPNETRKPLGFLVGMRSPLVGLLTVANTSGLDDVIFPEGIERVATISAKDGCDSGPRVQRGEDGELQGVQWWWKKSDCLVWWGSGPNAGFE